WPARGAAAVTLRLVVFIGLGDLARAGDLPRDLLGELQPRIEEPTLGKWRGMAEAIARQLDIVTAVVPEGKEIVLQRLPMLLNDAAGIETPETSFKALRNRLAHGGGVTRAVADSLLEGWRPRFAELWRVLRLFESVKLVVRQGVGVKAAFGLLRGPTARATHYEPDEPALREALEQAFAYVDVPAQSLVSRGGDLASR